MTYIDQYLVERQDFQMNCWKQDKIKTLEIKILKKGEKQDIPNKDLNNQGGVFRFFWGGE